MASSKSRLRSRYCANLNWELIRQFFSNNEGCLLLVGCAGLDVLLTASALLAACCHCCLSICRQCRVASAQVWPGISVLGSAAWGAVAALARSCAQHTDREMNGS